MFNLSIGAAAKQFMRFVSANATPISTGAVVIGIVSCVILAVKAGKESAEDLQEVTEELEEGEELTVKEVIHIVWKRFIPVFIVMVLTISCLIMSTRQMMKRYAALSAAYAISENYLKDYMEAAKETAGPKKEQAIRDKVMEKQVARHPVEERGIIETGHGTTLFFDAITGRWFRSSMDHVRQTAEKLASIYDSEDYLRLEDYTHALGLGSTEFGDYLGWRKTGKMDGSQTMFSRDGKHECLFFDYSHGMTDYDELYAAIYHHMYPITDLRMYGI